MMDVGPVGGKLVVKRPPFRMAHRIIWNNGGSWERFFLALGVLTYLFIPTISLGMFWAVWSRVLPYEVLFSFGLAATTYGAFHNAFSAALMNAKVWRHYIDEGRFRPHDEYFQEYARFLELEGEQGLLPGAVRWSVILWIAYFGIMTLAVVFTLALIPTFGLLTPFVSAIVDVVVVFPLSLAWQRHLRAIAREMDRKGYRLTDYAKNAGWVPIRPPPIYRRDR